MGLMALLGMGAMVMASWWVGRTTAMVNAGPDQAGDVVEVLQRAYVELAHDPRLAIAVLP
jgi:hypothetical protein